MRYVLQRINHLIFTDVETLQRNISKVTGHIRRKLIEAHTPDLDRKTLTFLTTHEGFSFHFDGTNYWRVSLFIPRSKSIDTTLTPSLAASAGRAFGDFYCMLADLPAESLDETIPNFHNMEIRLDQLHQAILLDKASRVAGVRSLIKELEKRSGEMCIQEQLYREGKLVKRINHCDTKINNVLFDVDTDELLCVIDLDTVMPGFVLSDIGDFIRTAVNTGAEDEEQLERISVDYEVFEAYITAYMSVAKEILTPTEIRLLPYGGRLLTYMQAVRFLTDYLNGDVYFKIHKAEHNLIRAIAQFEYLKRLEEAAPRMDALMLQWL